MLNENLCSPEHLLKTPWSPEFDLWSLGVVILEVLLGTELVLLLQTDDQVRALMRKVEPYLGRKLSHLVTRMTIFVDDRSIQSFLNADSLMCQEEVELAIDQIERAKSSNQGLKEAVRDFRVYASENAEELKTRYSYEDGERK